MFEKLPLLIGTTFLLLVVPGPDFVLVTRNALGRGRRAAQDTVVGICAGLGSLALVAATGFAAVIAAAPVMMLVLRVLGGVYLVLLGVVLVRSGWDGPDSRRDAGASRLSANSPVCQGFLNNVSNPKALIFYLAIMPGFLVPNVPVFAQTIVVGAVVVLCALVWWTCYVAVVGRMSTFMSRRRVRAGIDDVAGIALAVLGGALLLGYV